jgi:hypothetical protein
MIQQSPLSALPGTASENEPRLASLRNGASGARDEAKAAGKDNGCESDNTGPTGRGVLRLTLNKTSVPVADSKHAVSSPKLKLKLRLPNRTFAADAATASATASATAAAAAPDASAQTTTAASESRFAGTFRYRPFKLFPTEGRPIGSQFRVHIPGHWTSIRRNRALALNYFWRQNTLESSHGQCTYTDDSDVLCSNNTIIVGI